MGKKTFSLLPELGVGFTFFIGFEDILESNIDIVNVIEIEPQAYWHRSKANPCSYHIDDDVKKNIISFDCRKIIHSIGVPVGGTILPDTNQLDLLLRTVEEFSSPWISEHLSFNKVKNENEDFFTGFFLPPRQTLNGVTNAKRSIKKISDYVHKPVAVENGVSYLQTRDDELSDGDFVSRVIEESDCGLILDLHNAWTNEMNGRQSIKEFLSYISLDRVWEIHLGGGFDSDGYYLDAHSGAIPRQLIDLTRQIVPALPNLKAIIFELSPSYIFQVNSELMRNQIKILHELWDLRGTAISSIFRKETCSRPSLNEEDLRHGPSQEEWEFVLGSLVSGRDLEKMHSDNLDADPGIKIYRKLISTNRSSMIVNVLPFSSRLLMVNFGSEYFDKILSSFQKKFPPKAFASEEGEAFLKYLKHLELNPPYLKGILRFEKALHEALIHGQRRKLRLDFHLFNVLGSLVKFQNPKSNFQEDFEIEVGPELIERLRIT